MEKAMTLKRLKALLDRCLTEGISVKFVQPPGDGPPQWKDVFEMTLNAYLAALRDVREALEGDTSTFDEFLSAEGRFVDFFTEKSQDYDLGKDMR